MIIWLKNLFIVTTTKGYFYIASVINVKALPKSELKNLRVGVEQQQLGFEPRTILQTWNSTI